MLKNVFCVLAKFDSNKFENEFLGEKNKRRTHPAGETLDYERTRTELYSIKSHDVNDTIVRCVQLPKVPVHLPVWSQVSIHVWRVM